MAVVPGRDWWWGVFKGNGIPHVDMSSFLFCFFFLSALLYLPPIVFCDIDEVLCELYTGIVVLWYYFIGLEVL